MALNFVQNPTSAGLTEVGKRHNSYLPMQVFHKPIWDTMLFEQSNSFWFTNLIESYAGEMEPIKGNEFFWVEDGKWYDQQTIAAGGAVDNGGGSYTFTLTQTDPYFAANDVIDLGVAYPGREGINTLGRVTAVTSGASQTVTVQVLDPYGTAIAGLTAASFPTDHQLTLLYNSHGECFEKPACRIHHPERFSDKLTKIVDCHEVCDEASDQQIWFQNSKDGKFYWTDYETHGVMRLHKMHCDMALLFGQEHSFTDPTNANYAGEAGTGLIPWMSQYSTIGKFAGAITEDDLIQMVTQLGKNTPCNNFDVVMGCDLYRDSLSALREYSIGGGILYGKFGNKANRVGINYSGYQFGNTILRFMEYKPFSDPDFLPQNATGVNYRQMGLFICTEGNRLKIVYKKSRVKNAKIKQILDYQSGPTMTPNGQAFTANRACLTTLWTTHVGLQKKGANDFGMVCIQ